jgi:hypothetical protein
MMERCPAFVAGPKRSVEQADNIRGLCLSPAAEAECPVSDTFLTKDRDKRVANLEMRCKEKLGDGLFKKVRRWGRTREPGVKDVRQFAWHFSGLGL